MRDGVPEQAGEDIKYSLSLYVLWGCGVERMEWHRPIVYHPELFSHNAMSPESPARPAIRKVWGFLGIVTTHCG